MSKGIKHGRKLRGGRTSKMGRCVQEARHESHTVNASVYTECPEQAKPGHRKQAGGRQRPEGGDGERLLTGSGSLWGDEVWGRIEVAAARCECTTCSECPLQNGELYVM